MKKRSFIIALALATHTLTVTHSLGWGGPHGTITQAAIDSLPPWQRDVMGAEVASLGNLYCCIPDLVYTRKDLASYAMIPEQPGVVYLVNLHLPSSPCENHALLLSFLRRAVEALKANRADEAAKFAGTLAHMLEDWGCPAHAVPGDNMFTLFKQFLPPPEAYRYAPLHSPIENGSFPVGLQKRIPQLLGTTVDEAAFNLLQRSQVATIYARAQVVPIIDALYRSDTNACNAAQQKAAEFDAALVADALYTLICIGRSRVGAGEAAALGSASLSSFAPLEMPNLYPPQTAFCSKPFWGHATTDVALKNGRDPVPLRLLVDEQGQQAVRTFEHGIATGTRSTLTYLVPKDVYQSLCVRAGLHADLGATGQVRIDILGNGHQLASTGQIRGGSPSQRFCVPLAGLTNLQFVVTSTGGDGSGNYAVLADPRLVKASESDRKPR